MRHEVNALHVRSFGAGLDALRNRRLRQLLDRVLARRVSDVDGLEARVGEPGLHFFHGTGGARQPVQQHDAVASERRPGQAD